MEEVKEEEEKQEYGFKFVSIEPKSRKRDLKNELDQKAKHKLEMIKHLKEERKKKGDLGSQSSSLEFGV